MTCYSDEQQACLRRTAWIFMILLALGPLSFLLLPRIQSRATPSPPRWSTESFVTGRWTEQLRVYLRESSPLTRVLRGSHSEVAHLLGVDEPAVTRGRGGVLLLPVTTDPDNRVFERKAAERRLVFERVARIAAARGLRVLVAIAPNKARVWAAAWTESGELSGPRAGEYRMLLEEARAAGLETVDLAGPLTERARRYPAETLYYERDTHWNAQGAWWAAVAVAERIAELGWDAELGARQRLVAEPLRTRWVVPDLAERFGLFERGMFADEIGEEVFSRSIRVLDDTATAVVPAEASPGAGLALCGDSFAGAGLQWALIAALGREIDRQGVLPAAGPLRGLAETLERLDRGEIRARILVLEFVERSGGHEVWASPPPPLDRD